MFVTFSRAARDHSCAALVHKKSRQSAGFGRGRVLNSFEIDVFA